MIIDVEKKTLKKNVKLTSKSSNSTSIRCRLHYHSSLDNIYILGSHSSLFQKVCHGSRSDITDNMEAMAKVEEDEANTSENNEKLGDVTY